MEQLNSVIVLSLSIIFLVMSLYWVIVFSYRVSQSKKYLRVAARHLITEQSEDSRTEFEQICYHYQTEIRKYAYLLLISLSETFCMILYCLSALVDCDYITFPEIANSTKLKLSECSKIENKMLLEFQYNQAANPIRTTLAASQSIVEYLLVLMLSVCLMKYLTQRIKRVKHPGNHKFRPFIFFTALLSVFTVGIVWREYFAILLVLTLLVIYYCIFLRAVKQFEYTLLQIAYERLIQFGSNEKEFRQYKYFKYTMRSICCGYFFIIAARLLVYFPGFITSILFYGKCQFSLSVIPSYISVSENQVEISKLIQILNWIWYAGFLIGFLGTTLTLSPFICITLCTWIRQVYLSIHGKSKKGYRYRNDLQETLLDKD